jgi:hypothetical protein
VDLDALTKVNDKVEAEYITTSRLAGCLTTILPAMTLAGSY